MSSAELLKSLARDKASDLLKELPKIVSGAVGKDSPAAGNMAGRLVSEVLKLAEPYLYDGIDLIADELCKWFADAHVAITGDDHPALIDVGELTIH
jgi:hypothetical protein